MHILPEQPELCRELPQIVGNADYADFEFRLMRIDEILIRSGLEREHIERGLQRWLESGREEARKHRRFYRGPKEKAIRRQQRVLRQALRCTLARQLTEKDFRGFSRRLAESALLRWFCGIERVERVRVPGKSTLQRYERMVGEQDVRSLVNLLNVTLCEATEAGDPPLGLEQCVGPEVCWADTTCVKANIHFPTDWVLLRDAVRTLMKSVQLIRRKGLKHRMEEPEEFISQMNRLSIEMTNNRRRPGAVKARKKTLRKMKRLSKRIARHAERYHALLDERWFQTEWSRAEAEQVLSRIANVLAQLPEAMRQAHERIIGERQVANADKILSLYEEDVHVIVRGKASAEVEFGNTLYLAEQREGLIVDWKLQRDQSPGDPTLLDESLDRIHEVFDKYPIAVSADRGFTRRSLSKRLERDDIYDGICPKSPQELRRRCKDEVFDTLQRRRGQTEGRIGIFKNDFLGRPLRSKGFESRELAVSWAVLAHNLWVVARLPQAQVLERAA